MTFLPIFGNLRKMCALDCGTNNFMREKKSQFLDSLMDKRLSFQLKRCGFESSMINLFFFLFNLLVCMSLFLIWCTHGYIFLESGIRLLNKYTRRNVNIFSRNDITLCTLGEFNSFIVISAK